MPGIMIERPKMTRTMYQALKRHIMKERERKKQEQAQDEELEKQRKEQELRRKKEAQDSLTLEQTKEQIAQLETKLESMKQEKHGLFSQLKKVLHQEDENRKRAQEKEHNEMVASMQQQPQQFQGMAPAGGQHMYIPSQMSKYMNVSTIQQHRAMFAGGQKRQRSPSPTPPSVYSTYPPNKYQAAAYASSVKQEYSAPPKTAPSYAPQSTHVTYVSQSGHSYAQANPALYPGSGSKYSSSQSAFSTYPSHYAHQQQIKEHAYPAPKEHTYPTPKEHAYPGQKKLAYAAQKEHPYSGQFPVSRLPQQPTRAQPAIRAGYLAPAHSSSSMPLQQQLEHANKQSGFAEDKYKLQQMRGLAHHPATAPPSGSISSGFPVRTQASSSSAYQPQTSQSVVSSSQQHAYAQHRYF